MQYNKYRYQVYENNYEMDKLTIILCKRVAFASFFSAVFTILNPFLLVFLIPEYVATMYSFNLFANLVDNITLEANKQNISVHNFNFLGKFIF